MRQPEEGLPELVRQWLARADTDLEETRYPGDSPEMLPGAEAEVLRIARHVKERVEQSLRRYPEPA
jgi:hypothetical protein